MGTEILLYFYGLVCLSMLAFNIVYSLYLRLGDRKLDQRVSFFSRAVSDQLQHIRAGQPVETRHLASLNRRLSRVSNLLAYDRALEALPRQDAAVESYQHQIEPTILYLATKYRRRENTQAAFFCYFLAQNRILRQMPMDEIQRILVTFTSRDSLYCRVNALKALCAFGSAETIVDTLLYCDRQSSFLHAKVLVETLLSFTGNHAELIRLVWERFDRFSNGTKRALLDYIRFNSGAYCEQMLGLMLDPKTDKELRLAAIRYFGRYYYLPAKQPLLEFVSSPDELNWEYAAISATALSNYTGEDVDAALVRAIHSSNWYVRYNAAISLESHGMTYEEMLAAVGPGDRYAREMLAYRLESRRQQEETLLV